MYEELIKALRLCGEEEGCFKDCPYYEKCFSPNGHIIFGVMQEAADAIEELSKENEQFAKMAKVFIDGMNEISEKCADIAGIQAEPPKGET